MKKLSAFVLIAMAMTMLLTACQRPASKQPVASNTPQSGGFPLPGVTEVVETPAPEITEAPAETAAPSETETPTICETPQGWVTITTDSDTTVTDLAAKYNTTMEALTQGNCLSSGNVSAGTVLFVPPSSSEAGGGQEAACTPNPPSDWVQKVFTAGALDEIATQYGTTVEDLMSANCLTEATLAQTTILFVPPTEQAAAPETGSTESGSTSSTTETASTAAVTATEHRLERGEFPYCIARRYNLSPDSLLTLNGLSRNGIFYKGLKLVFPTDGKTFPVARALHAHPATYTAVGGETIYAVACYYGDVMPEDIASLNSLSVDAVLTAGQTLSIP